MTNPGVYTPEGRGALRRLCVVGSPMTLGQAKLGLDLALDGLDIAEEMAADLELHDPNSPALAKWHEWQGVGGTRGGER